MNDIPKESVIIDELDPRTWIAGAESGVPYKELLQAPDWSPFMPTYENQIRDGFDAVSCVTYQGLSSLEFQLERMRQRGLLRKEILDFFIDNGYIDSNNKINFSDRFSSIMSGTTWHGNNMTNPMDSFRRDGVIPEKMLPYPDLTQFKDADGRITRDYECFKFYSNPAVITQEMKDLGKKFLKFFDIRYEVVYYNNMAPLNLNVIRYHLKHAPLSFAAPVASGEGGDSVIPGVGCGAGHARLIYRDMPEDQWHTIFDSFARATKKLGRDWCIPYVYKMVITTRNAPVVPDKFTHNFLVKLTPGDKNNEVIALQRTLQILKDKNGKPYLDPRIVPVPIFGPQTKAAVIAFQLDRAVATPGEIKLANGVVGPKTREALTKALIDNK